MQPSPRFWIVFAFHAVLWSYLVWVWVRWVNPTTATGSQDWRGIRFVVVFIGWVAATISVALDAFLLIHALFTGGFPFFHPVEMFCGRLGGLTALLGLIFSAAGKGGLRRPTAICSGFAFFLWWTWAVTL